MNRTTGVDATALSIAARVSEERNRVVRCKAGMRCGRGRVWRKACEGIVSLGTTLMMRASLMAGKGQHTEARGRAKSMVTIYVLLDVKCCDSGY